MTGAEQLGYHVNIRRYVQWSAFGYCRHNGWKGDITTPTQPKNSSDEAGARSDTSDLMSRLWSRIDLHEAGHGYRSAVTPRARPRYNIVALRHF
jgi:hypothetical protein